MRNKNSIPYVILLIIFGALFLTSRATTRYAITSKSEPNKIVEFMNKAIIDYNSKKINKTPYLEMINTNNIKSVINLVDFLGPLVDTINYRFEKGLDGNNLDFYFAYSFSSILSEQYSIIQIQGHPDFQHTEPKNSIHIFNKKRDVFPKNTDYFFINPTSGKFGYVNIVEKGQGIDSSGLQNGSDSIDMRQATFLPFEVIIDEGNRSHRKGPSILNNSIRNVGPR